MRGSLPRIVSILCVACLHLAPVVARAQAPFLLSTRFDVVTGDGPYGIACADFDGDGRPDVATANFTGASISVMRGLGNGSFAARVDYPATFHPNALLAGDLNGDGKPDLVAGDWDATAITVLLGQGDGTFVPGPAVSTAAQARAIALADFDEDDRLDLATAHSSSGDVTVRMGDGSGGFGAEVAIGTGVTPVSVTAGDVNGDGHFDLVVLSQGTATAQVFLGDGHGAFTAGVNYTTGSTPTVAVLYDLDGDGDLDLAVATYEGRVGVRLGDGSGGFGARVDYVCNSRTLTLAVADVTGDGQPDLVTADALTLALNIQVNTGAGTFAAPTSESTSLYPSAVAVADLDSDGHPDILAADRGSNAVTSLLGCGAADHAAPVGFNTGASPDGIAVGDIDGDGHLDAVVANTLAASVTVLRGDGAGGFGSRVDVSAAFPTEVALADVNEDGHLDLLSLNPLGGVSVFLNDGGDGYGQEDVYDAGPDPVSLQVADLNGDHHLDVCVAQSNGYQVSVMPGDGSGTFPTRTAYAEEMSGAERITQMVLGQFDADAFPDVAFVSSPDQVVGLMINNGAGGFGYATLASATSPPLGLAAGNLNGAGPADIVTCNPSTHAVNVRLGAPNGFQSSNAYAVSGTAKVIAVGDLNGDGRDDVASADPMTGIVTILHGPAGSIGQLRGRIDLTVGPNVAGLAIADVNADGAPDLLATVHGFGVNQLKVVRGLARTATTLHVSPWPVAPGQPLTLVAHITSAGGPPAGTVAFADGGTPLGSAPVIGGTASLQLASAVLPARRLAAVYGGSPSLRPSASIGLDARVSAGPVTAVGGRSAPSALGIRLLGGNPVRTAVPAFAIELPGEGAAALELFDLGGRRLAARSIAGRAGGQVVSLRAEVMPASGVYLARLTQGKASLTRRITILR